MQIHLSLGELKYHGLFLSLTSFKLISYNKTFFYPCKTSNAIAPWEIIWSTSTVYQNPEQQKAKAMESHTTSLVLSPKHNSLPINGLYVLPYDYLELRPSFNLRIAFNNYSQKLSLFSTSGM